MLRVPDLTPSAVAKLAHLADLEKRGQPWDDEPRVPAGQAGGGQWTTDDGGQAGGSLKPAHQARPVSPPRTARFDAGRRGLQLQRRPGLALDGDSYTARGDGTLPNNRVWERRGEKSLLVRASI